MTLSDAKAPTFDSGKTVLDWHTGFRDAVAQAGWRHGIDRDRALLPMTCGEEASKSNHRAR